LKLLLILPIMAGVFYAFATPEYRYIQAEDNSLAAIQKATPSIENMRVEVKDTVKSSVTTLEGNFVAPSPMGTNSPVSGFRFSAKKIQGQYGKGTEIIKGDDISLDLGNTTSTIFIDGKEATKTEFDKLDPNTIASVSILKGESATTVYGDKGKNGVILITLKKVENDVYTLVEQMPEFPGGEEALKIYMASNIKYPEIALENGIQGKVFISFVVNKEGRISNAKVMRSIDPALDQEALRVVESMPSWIPGKQNGKEVDVEYTLPVEFKFPKELRNKNTTAIGYASYSDPAFPGGEEALKAYIAATKKYPADVLENGIIGRAVIGFIVNEKGEIKSAKIVRGVHPSLDQEALRVINLMPNWIPANKNGENISAAWEIAIGFPKTADYPANKSGKIIVPSNKKAEVKPTINQAGQMYELIIIPNPTSDKARITLKDSNYNSKLQISVFDKDGKLIHKDTKTGPTFNLSFGNYPSGNYFIVVKAGKDQYSGHLIVNH
ncbi:MAG TPA: TonB family protein, partial [Prolixibacteraceae bacterium]|nr:TonB family protein [Prolixibacteraceae bacterium]